MEKIIYTVMGVGLCAFLIGLTAVDFGTKIAIMLSGGGLFGLGLLMAYIMVCKEDTNDGR